MELFKNLEDKVNYVEALTCLATASEKITDTKKTFVFDIVANYGISEEYVEKIWDSLRRKKKTADILAPLSEADQNVKLMLVQELITIFLISGKYLEEKPRLIEVMKIFGLNIKLGSLKEYVAKNLKRINQAEQEVQEN